MNKKVFDIVVAGLGLTALGPVFGLCCVAVSFSSPGPVFFRGARIGYRGKPFHIIKFRSMVKDAATRGPGITTGTDSRVTRVGAFLRRTKLDELPQLINVLKGDMSLVGPRPEDPRYVALYTASQRRILDFRPGITSPASFAFRDESILLGGMDWERSYIQEIMPAKIRLDLEYFERQSCWGDLLLILRTVGAVFTPNATKATCPP